MKTYLLATTLLLSLAACVAPKIPGDDGGEMAGDGDGDDPSETEGGDGDGDGDTPEPDMPDDMMPLPDLPASEDETGDGDGDGLEPACCVCGVASPWCEHLSGPDECEALSSDLGLPTEWHEACEPDVNGKCVGACE